MSKEQEIEALITPVIADIGLECLGLVFSPGRGNSLLRVYIDHPDRPINLDDCESVSREISAVMDVNDPIVTRYTLEVSSPGIDRPLFKPAHFARFINQVVKITVKLPVSGRRRFQGKILAVAGEKISLEQDGNLVVLEHVNVENARLLPELPIEFEKTGKQTKPGSKKASPSSAAAKKLQPSNANKLKKAKSKKAN